MTRQRIVEFPSLFGELQQARHLEFLAPCHDTAMAQAGFIPQQVFVQYAAAFCLNYREQFFCFC
ncbi:hypothetical protein [Selenomonas sp. AE3005]|uniref:hypothetical protein n=1 Tax=Selenomonas sp. AE3005 TaxID=1485543 RepID=UPI0012DCFFDE|nr:hypothetical protein [Selenomonas sp. AE3005]